MTLVPFDRIQQTEHVARNASDIVRLTGEIMWDVQFKEHKLHNIWFPHANKALLYIEIKMHIMSSSIREKNINSNKALRSILIYWWEKLYKTKLSHVDIMLKYY